MSGRHGTIAMIGAGSWGTALSIALGGAGRPVRLWARRAELARALARDRRNPEYLSEFELPDSVTPTDDLGEAVEGVELVVLAVPSQGIRAVCERLEPYLGDEQIVVSAAKGLDHETGRRLSETIMECVRPGRCRGIAVLSGPNLAPEVAAGDATVSVAASEDRELATEVQGALSTPRFRVYTNPDVLGVELGGVLKNIIAIGAGVSDGLGFGDNTKAALMTRGLAEMTRLGVALGARAETFRGLSGMGDLVATCAGRKSRNHFVGHELAGGRALEDILADIAPQVAEGVETARAALRLAASAGVEMPIATAVQQMLFEGLAPKEAVRALMTRAWRDELEE
ncbi:MAG TPA: NAD(P)H-dependent glycerol-3-phosphate dehydrogenase [Armatimonadota bacterium]|nr:NAD(P)H-dependent glycerol-3-phosphate dehydrogenase [Armatimonadota bacterium]